jgi:hypothetical protein
LVWKVREENLKRAYSDPFIRGRVVFVDIKSVQIMRIESLFFR